MRCKHFVAVKVGHFSCICENIFALHIIGSNGCSATIGSATVYCLITVFYSNVISIWVGNNCAARVIRIRNGYPAPNVRNKAVITTVCIKGCKRIRITNGSSHICRRTTECACAVSLNGYVFSYKTSVNAKCCARFSKANKCSSKTFVINVSLINTKVFNFCVTVNCREQTNCVVVICTIRRGNVEVKTINNMSVTVYLARKSSRLVVTIPTVNGIIICFCAVLPVNLIYIVKVNIVG